MKTVMRFSTGSKADLEKMINEYFYSENYVIYHTVNYRCCPSCHKAKNIFGLYLEYGNDENITIKEGWLQPV